MCRSFYRYPGIPPTNSVRYELLVAVKTLTTGITQNYKELVCIIVCVCVCACVRACVRVCVPACVRVFPSILGMMRM